MGNWKKARLTDLAEYINGFAFKPSDFSEGGVPIVRIEQLKNPNGNFDYFNGKIPERNWINNGDLIFSWSASLFLKIWQNDFAYLNQHLFKVLPKEDVQKYFLKYLLEGAIEELTKMSHGSTMQHITRKELQKFEVKFPSDFNEQSTIATILTTIDQAIEKTEQIIAKYERIKTGLMQDLLTRGIDEQGNIRSEETHEFKDSVLGRIPKEWEVNKLGNWIRVKGGNAFQSRDFTSGGIQLLRIGNLFNNQFDLHRSPVFLPESYSLKFPEFVLKSGDVIMSMTGTYGKRDYGYAILIEKGEYLLNQRLCKLIFDEGRIDKSFLLFLLRSEYYLDELFKSVTGSKQGNLRNSNILDVKVGLPDIREQRKISEKISLLYEVVQKEGRNLEKLEKQKNALMQDLLTGKVSVDTILDTKTS
jgi:type I restriction enzyme, S subunit